MMHHYPSNVMVYDVYIVFLLMIQAFGGWNCFAGEGIVY